MEAPRTDIIPIGSHREADAYVLKHANGSSDIVSFSKRNTLEESGNGGAEYSIQGLKIWRWGRNNDLPNVRERLVQDNNIVGELLSTKQNILIGQGLYTYKESFENGKKVQKEVPIPEIEKDFWDEINIEKYLRDASKNLVFHAIVFTEFIRNKGGNVIDMRALQCRHVRPEMQDANGRILRFFWCGNWSKAGLKDGTQKWDIKPIQNFRKGSIQSKYVYHAQYDLLGDDYLACPSWWGGRAWIELANAIPVFHLNNMKNGYSIRYHIEVPKDYWWDQTAAQGTKEQKEAALRKESEQKSAFLKTLNEFLAGAENAGKAVVTEFEINRAVAKEYPGIKITPLNVDLKDESLLSLFEKSNEANISGSGIHPTLAAVQTQGKLSSGSEIRNAFNMFVAIKTPILRSILLEPINHLRKQNGWDKSIKYGFKDIILETLDENPTGTSNIVNGNK